MSIAADLAPSGVLRASINLGNPVLAQGTADAPSGVTVDIAHELGRRLGLPVEFICFDAARKSFEALTSGLADICFLAIEPARAAEVSFTAPYALIEGVFAVRADSPLLSVSDVDRSGVRIGVKQGSAYDLYLTRTLRHATIVRGVEGTAVFQSESLDVAAGIRQPVTDFVAGQSGLRVIDEAFMLIQQAVGATKARGPETVQFLHAVVEDLKASGFVAESLLRSHQLSARVAPAAS
nr:transporter substrate-binding domain-containing protein [Kibdelosporangium sp. MJ126-NF4]CEL19189.1 probable extracellular solute-binding protein [Kibdelosporangium sp. MJ126-NF4]CTQ95010.1 probable extracellular solute-binding protein [Kibdelosporangium sp. MJ126-NF4]